MEEEEDVIGGHEHHVHRRHYRRRGGIAYARNFADDDAVAGYEEYTNARASPGPDTRSTNVQRIMPGSFLYGDPANRVLIANIFMQRYTQSLSPVFANEPPNTECPICLEPPSETHECVQIRNVPGCTHLIGRECLRQFFVNGPDGKKDCPFCRTQWLSVQGVWDIEDELIAAAVPDWPWRE